MVSKAMNATTVPQTAQWIIAYGSIHNYLVYGVIIALACAEGPWLSLILGVLIRLGFFLFWPVYAALMAGDLIGDVVWYHIGRKYGHGFIARHGARFGITEGGVERMSGLFHKHKDWVLFVSKISNGFGLALVTLMTAGMVRIPFWRYMLINFIGQFIWTGLLVGIGYFFSHMYLTVNNLLGRMALIAFTVLAAAAVWRLWRTMKEKAGEFD